MSMRRFSVFGAIIAILASSGLGLTLSASAVNTVNVAITGSVQCEHGLAVEGVWVASSGGGSGWAGRLTGHDATVNYFRYPSAHGTFSTAAGSQITLDVGCGGKPSAWASNNATAPSVAASGSGNLVVNAYNCVASSALVSGKTVKGTCQLPSRGTPGSATVNPASTAVSGSLDCTCGAAYMWKQNGGPDSTYPGWGGNAAQWANNAQNLSKRWTVVSYPAPHALLVDTTTDPPYGHVGWVTGINVLTGLVTYIDMNGPDTCGANGRSSCSYQFQSRTVPLTSLETNSYQFILRQPGYEWSWGSAAYPATPQECQPIG
jgi:surface antigen